MGGNIKSRMKQMESFVGRERKREKESGILRISSQQLETWAY